MTAFEEFGVMPELGAAVDEMGWTLPTDVQVGCSLLNSLEIGSILEKWALVGVYEADSTGCRSGPL